MGGDWRCRLKRWQRGYRGRWYRGCGRCWIPGTCRRCYGTAGIVSVWRRVRSGSRVGIALSRPDGTCFVHRVELLPHEGENRSWNLRYSERLIKFLLWQRGGSRIWVAGCEPLAAALAAAYTEGGERAFDVDLVGRKIFLEPVVVARVWLGRAPGSARAVGGPGGGTWTGAGSGLTWAAATGSVRRCSTARWCFRRK